MVGACRLRSREAKRRAQFCGCTTSPGSRRARHFSAAGWAHNVESIAWPSPSGHLLVGHEQVDRAFSIRMARRSWGTRSRALRFQSLSRTGWRCCQPVRGQGCVSRRHEPRKFRLPLGRRCSFPTRSEGTPRVARGNEEGAARFSRRTEIRWRQGSDLGGGGRRVIVEYSLPERPSPDAAGGAPCSGR